MILLDTNILLRYASAADPDFAVVEAAVNTLRANGEVLCVVPQNLYEFWAAATRPTAANGLGLSTAVARTEMERLEHFFIVLRETPALYPAWKRLVFEYQVSGKPTYDARLVAAMQVYGITASLTFNPSDFRRYAGIEVFDPTDIVSSTGSA